ncbi:MAG: polysaccharide deacetylase family protein [Clostridia bacterium]|nr:polysaccharide deacetylase family protein [Clostridia bacterium]
METFSQNTPSEKKESWGMRRNLPDRPVFTDAQKATMDKYGCIYMGTDEQKYLYLTFDEGYENGQTGKILDTLREKNVKATFFITGDYFKSEGELIDRMVNEGHEVGNHTMSHPSVAALDEKKIEEELLGLDLAYYVKYKKHMKYFRPPEGVYSEKCLDVINNLGYKSVFWSFAYDDWYRDKTRGADYAYNKTIENIHPGCVILLHAVSRDNAEALGRIIDSAREAGYTFLPLDEYIP